MYNPRTVSEMLDIPPSTLRRLAGNYADLLSEAAGKSGSKRFYTDDDVLTLKRISAYTRQRKTPDEIRQLLQVVEPEPEPTNALALLPTVLAEFEHLRGQIASLNEQIQTSQEKHDQTSHELSETRQRLDRLEDWLKLPWYKRLTSRPPE